MRNATRKEIDAGYWQCLCDHGPVQAWQRDPDRFFEWVKQFNKNLNREEFERGMRLLMGKEN